MRWRGGVVVNHLVRGHQSCTVTWDVRGLASKVRLCSTAAYCMYSAVLYYTVILSNVLSCTICTKLYCSVPSLVLCSCSQYFKFRKINYKSLEKC